MKHWVLLTVVAILFFAGVTRIIKWTLFDRYAGDEGNQLISISHLFKYHDFFIGGETSTLDEKTYTSISNSPLSLYLQSFFYLVCFGSTRCYTFNYVVLSIITCFFLFLTAKNLFNLKAAFVTLITFAFSNVALFISTWPSQPVHAIFFEVVSLYFLSLFLKKKKPVWLFSCYVAGLIGLQMYPPMYLFLPVQIGVFSYLFSRYVQKKTQILIYLVLVTLLIYSPLIFFEIQTWNTPRSNIDNIRYFLTQHSQKDDSIIHNLSFLFSNFLPLPFYISNLLLPLSPFFLSLFGLGIFFVIKNTQTQRKKILGLLLLIVFPIVTITFLKGNFVQTGGYFLKAYFEVFVIYITLLYGSLVYSFKNKFYFLIILLFPVILFASTGRNQIFVATDINLSTKEKIVAHIQREMEKKNLTYKEITLAVSNTKFNNNSGQWDNSMYWYLLENKLDERLVRMDKRYTYPYPIYIHPKLTFIICEDNLKSVEIEECFDRNEILLPASGNTVSNQAYFDKHVIVFTVAHP